MGKAEWIMKILLNCGSQITHIQAVHNQKKHLGATKVSVPEKRANLHFFLLAYNKGT